MTPETKRVISSKFAHEVKLLHENSYVWLEKLLTEYEFGYNGRPRKRKQPITFAPEVLKYLVGMHAALLTDVLHNILQTDAYGHPVDFDIIEKHWKAYTD